MSLIRDDAFNARLKQRMEEEQQQQDSRRYDPKVIAEKIKTHVIGQDSLAETIARLVFSKSSRKIKTGTLANILISGPTGTGKSEIAKAVSEAVFGSRDFMLQIDCGNLGTSSGSLASLVGAPQVYRGSSRGALGDYLTKAKGEGVILFDEFEKAAPTKDAPLAKMLLKLMDEGKFQSQFDMSVLSATGCIVVLTSNLKQQELAEASRQYTNPEDLEEACKRILGDAMAPEFLERLDLVTTTAPLSGHAMAQIVMLQFEKLASSHGVQVVNVELGFYDLLVAGAAKFGKTSTRGVTRWLATACEDTFIEAANTHHWRVVTANWQDDKLILRPVSV